MRTVVLFALSLALTALTHAAPGLALEAETSHDFYPEGGNSNILVQARVTAVPVDAAPAAQNLILVLDRSGSMAGDRMAALQAAASSAITALPAEDRVAVLTFGSEVETVLPSTPRGELTDIRPRLERIEPEGGSALYDALSQAAAQLRRHARDDVLNRIVLVTDGPATKGPREPADFAALAAALAREGISIATIGLGDDAPEDLLASISQPGRERFRYADTPVRLGVELAAATRSPGPLLGLDAVLTFEFSNLAENPTSEVGLPATNSGRTLSYALPRLVAGPPVVVLASAEFPASVRHVVTDAVIVRLRWRGPRDGEVHELAQQVDARFASDSSSLRHSARPDVIAAAVDAAVAEGIEDAIARYDQHDARGVLRALRQARRDALDLNFGLDDPRISATVDRLEACLARFAGRELGPTDRKVLRSGVFNDFDAPFPRPPEH